MANPDEDAVDWENVELGDARFPIGMPEDKAEWDGERERLLRRELPLRKPSSLHHLLYLAGSLGHSLTSLGKPLAALAVALPLIAAVVVVATSGSDKPEEASFYTRSGQPPANSGPSSASRQPASVAAMAMTQPLSFQVFRSSDLTWPSEGRIAASFGIDGQTALTIDAGRAGGAVRAGSRGVVAMIVLEACCGYQVSLNHEGGRQTTYSGLGEIQVVPGQRLERDQIIGSIPGGGRLRFELRENGIALDPLLYLPASGADPSAMTPETASCSRRPISLDPASSARLLLVAEGARYSIESASATPLGTEAQPALDVQVPGSQAITIRVPPAATASGSPREYDLALSLRGSEGRYTANCRLALSTASFVPAHLPPVVLVQLDFEWTPTPVATAVTKAPPTSTPRPVDATTRTPAPQTSTTPTRTPIPSATRTPSNQPAAPFVTTPITARPATSTPAKR